MMKLGVGSLILLAGLISPSYGNAQAVALANGAADSQASAKISVSFEKTPIQDAVWTIAKKAGVRILFAEDLLPARQVTYKGVGVAPAVALAAVLEGTRIRVNQTPGGFELVQIKGSNAAKTQGLVVGKIVDAKTGKGIAGATVVIDNDTRGVTSGDDGSYRLSGVATGTRVLSVRSVGYAKQSRSATISDGVTITVDFKLEPSANVLDQVVVTGTATATELKAVPNAITVVTAKQLEERGITRIDQLFRGDVPGLFAQNSGSNTPLDEVTVFSRGVTAFPGGLSAGTDLGTNPIKTYVDGVEMADAKYISQIDPKSIERIEILTGPQASTIYGSNAINGVMQIFTKRGTTSRPQVTLNLLSGWVENNFRSSRTPQHDYSAQVNGIEGRLSYNAGFSWNYIGPWTPSKQTTRLNGSGGARFQTRTPIGQVTSDVSLRSGVTQNIQRGTARQLDAVYYETGLWRPEIGSNGTKLPTTYSLNGQTIGFTLGYAPTSWWSHEFGWGLDRSDSEQRRTARAYQSPNDTTLYVAQSRNSRKSLRYTTTVSVPVSGIAQATVTLGGDGWQSLTSSMSAIPQTLTGTLTNVSGVTRQPEHNTGGFIQSQIGLMDKLFITYGLRAEWNPNYGADAQPNLAPRFGAAYSQEFGPITTKLRGSYGRSTRPPQRQQKNRVTMAESYGPQLWALYSSYFIPWYSSADFDYNLANEGLSPEYQKGGEGGIEVYLGNRGSIVVTRYNQTVDGLIVQPQQADSIRTLQPCDPDLCFAFSMDSDGYGYMWQSQYINMGSIRNQGWETQGSLNLGPITTRGTYSWTKSRTIGILQKYRAMFAGVEHFVPGASFSYLPEHTWALNVAYAKAGTMVGIVMNGIGKMRSGPNDFYNESLSTFLRLQQSRQNYANITNYRFMNEAYSTTDLNASHKFSQSVEALLQVQNLTDFYQNDLWSIYPVAGRQSKFGLRIRL